MELSKRLPAILMTLALIGAALPLTGQITQPAAAAAPASTGCGELSLDGLPLSLCTAFLSQLAFTAAPAGSSDQVSYALDPRDPGRAIAVTAIPFGRRAGSEIFPAASAGAASSALAQLAAFRQGQGGRPTPGPVASFFGQEVESIASQADLPGPGAGQPAQLTEWVFTAAGRLWIVRAVQALSPVQAQLRLGSSPDDLSLDSPGLSNPASDQPAVDSLVYLPFIDTLRVPTLAYTYLPFLATLPTTTTGTDYPTPSWWAGACDNGHYQGDPYMNPYHYAAYPLGTSYRNVPACGPRPGYYEGPDVMIYFYDGAFPVYEWECVELSLRFMYVAYGVPPYAANGNRVVWNYSGSRMSQIANGTAGKTPVAGDVLSMCYWCTYGHTSVVIASDVNASGNGSITVMEENNSPNGKAVLGVANWWVAGNLGPVSGWLHSNP